MRIRVADRIICGLVGLLLLAFCASVVAQAAFKVPVFSIVDRYLSSGGIMPTVILIISAVILFVLGVYCFLLLFRHRGRKGMFAVQKMEGGELSISVHVLNTLVMKCVESHPEIKVNSLYIENTKDGLIIVIRGTASAGVSIPLTVDVIQQQIRQYLTSCTGIPIKEIITEIQSTANEIEDASFPVEKPKQISSPAETGNKAVEIDKFDNPDIAGSSERSENNNLFVPQHDIESVQRAVAEVQQTVADQPEKKTEVFSTETPQTSIPAPVADDEADDERPLHQRLFTHTTEPCVIPEPEGTDAQISPDSKASEGNNNPIDPLQVAGIEEKIASAGTSEESKE